MVDRKPREPGLDVTLSDEALDEFIWGPMPRFEEAPQRRWPAVAVGVGFAFPVGLTVGTLIVSSFGAGVGLALAVSGFCLAGVVTIVWSVYREDGE